MRAVRAGRLSLAPGLVRSLPFFYGWVVVAATGSAMFARTAASSGVLSVFLRPMADDLGWSVSLISGAASLGGLVGSILGPVVGRLADRYGPRTILGVSMILLGVSTALLGTVTVPLAFYLAYLVGRAIFACPVPIATTVAVGNWFRVRRARAMAVANGFSFVGLASFPLVVQATMSVSSWRVAWLVLGILVWAIALGPTILLPVRRPEDLGVEPDGGRVRTDPAGSGGVAPVVEVSWTLREALRTRVLWLLSLSGACMFAVQAGISVHQTAYFRARGMDPLVAASIVSVMALANFAGALLSGFLAERLGARRLYGLAAVAMAAVMIFLLLVRSPAQAYLYAALLGTAIGTGLTLNPVLFADYYGREALGAIRGVAEPCISLGQAAGVLMAGIVFDQTGAYSAAILAFAGLATLSAILIAVSRPPRRDTA